MSKITGKTKISEIYDESLKNQTEVLKHYNYHL